MKKAIITIVCSLIIMQSIFLANFFILAFDEGYYQEQFSKVHTYSRVPDAELRIADILQYLKGEKQAMDSRGFSEREITHMADVKEMFIKARVYLYLLLFTIFLTFAGFVAFTRNRTKTAKIIANTIILGSLLAIAIAILLFAMSTSFSQMFSSFHTPFFQPGSYVFSEDNLLIRLFPQAFFYNSTFDVMLRSAITALMLLTAALILKKKYLNKAEPARIGKG